MRLYADKLEVIDENFLSGFLSSNNEGKYVLGHQTEIWKALNSINLKVN